MAEKWDGISVCGGEGVGLGSSVMADAAMRGGEVERERRGFEWGEDKRRSDLGGFFSCRERKMWSIGPGRFGIYL